MRQRGLQLAISSEKGGGRYVPFLEKQVREAHGVMRSHITDLSVLIARDAAMARLHEEFLHIAGPTDVLTFELERRDGKMLAGEIIICLDEARRQARKRKIAVSHELLLYAVHGMLHLAGFDDRTRADYEKMHREEDRILERIGVGAVFVRDARRD